MNWLLFKDFTRPSNLAIVISRSKYSRCSIHEPVVVSISSNTCESLGNCFRKRLHPSSPTPYYSFLLGIHKRWTNNLPNSITSLPDSPTNRLGLRFSEAFVPTHFLHFWHFSLHILLHVLVKVVLSVFMTMCSHCANICKSIKSCKFLTNLQGKYHR